MREILLFLSVSHFSAIAFTHLQPLRDTHVSGNIERKSAYVKPDWFSFEMLVKISLKHFFIYFEAELSRSKKNENSSIQYKFIINNTKNQNPFQNLKKVWLFVYFLIQYNDLNTAHRKNKPVVRKKKDFCMLWFVYTFVYKKDFTLMNSNTEHIYCYAQKYCHFLAKFHYHKDLLKARTIHIVFWLEEKLYVRQKKQKSFFAIFPPN